LTCTALNICLYYCYSPQAHLLHQRPRRQPLRHGSRRSRPRCAQPHQGGFRPRLAEERSASYGFLSEVLRPDKDRAFIIHFDRVVELLQDLTSTRDKLGDALARLHERSEGGTDLYDSVLLASDELMTKETGRKAIVLLTDGVYASRNGKNALQRISRETGGAFFEVSHSGSISAIYLKLEEAAPHPIQHRLHIR
jgi:hypothetical protein